MIINTQNTKDQSENRRTPQDYHRTLQIIERSLFNIYRTWNTQSVDNS